MSKGPRKIPHPVFEDIEVFQGISSEDLADLASRFHCREFSQGEFLFLEGQPANVYYLVAEGRVKILQNSIEGFQIFLHILGPGELLGALPTLGEGTYPATAEALEDLVTFAIEAEAFETVLHEYPSVTRRLLRFATRKLQETHARLREMATERVERRIARTLGRLAAQIGKKVPDGILLEAPLSRQDLAEMCGTTLFTMSRTLKAWERKGWLRAGRTKIIILQPHALTTLAEDLPQ
jgi:CRP-like cAMP-binding protein